MPGTGLYGSGGQARRFTPTSRDWNAQGTVHGAPLSVFASSGLGAVPCAGRRAVTVTARLTDKYIDDENRQDDRNRNEKTEKEWKSGPHQRRFNCNFSRTGRAAPFAFRQEFRRNIPAARTADCEYAGRAPVWHGQSFSAFRTIALPPGGSRRRQYVLAASAGELEHRRGLARTFQRYCSRQCRGHIPGMYFVIFHR